jgi:hypothetical protein
MKLTLAVPVKIVCAWCGCHLRLELWPLREGMNPDGITSHGICSVCAEQVKKNNLPKKEPKL